MKPATIHQFKSRSQLIADSCRRISGHWAAIADEFEKFEGTHGLPPDQLASLRLHEQGLGVGANAAATVKTKKNSSSTYLSLSEIAALIGMDTRSLHRIRNNPETKFPVPLLFGRTFRWKAVEIEEWVERQRYRP